MTNHQTQRLIAKLLRESNGLARVPTTRRKSERLLLVCRATTRNEEAVSREFMSETPTGVTDPADRDNTRKQDIELKTGGEECAWKSAVAKVEWTAWRLRYDTKRRRVERTC